MAMVIDCSDPVAVLPGMREARGAIARGALVVLPTDTVYGVAADAFDPAAVQRLLDAKGRGRKSPPPVLVPTKGTLAALAEVVPEAITHLIDVFWPGPLTVVLPARSSLVWDLGETNGTVAVRMPDNRIALELLAETGPLAVSSANRTGEPAATNAAAAEEQLGDSIAVYLDGGTTAGSAASTIVDGTALAAGTGPLRILRHGVLTEAALLQVVPEAFAAFDETADDELDDQVDNEEDEEEDDLDPDELYPIGSPADEEPEPHEDDDEPEASTTTTNRAAP